MKTGPLPARGVGDLPAVDDRERYEGETVEAVPQVLPPRLPGLPAGLPEELLLPRHPPRY